MPKWGGWTVRNPRISCYAPGNVGSKAYSTSGEPMIDAPRSAELAREPVTEEEGQELREKIDIALIQIDELEELLMVTIQNRQKSRLLFAISVGIIVPILIFMASTGNIFKILSDTQLGDFLESIRIFSIPAIIISAFIAYRAALSRAQLERERFRLARVRRRLGEALEEAETILYGSPLHEIEPYIFGQPY